MSNALQTLVPVLDGSNYRRWAELMQAYLQQQEVWIIVNPLRVSLSLRSTKLAATAPMSLRGTNRPPKQWAA